MITKLGTGPAIAVGFVLMLSTGTASAIAHMRMETLDLDTAVTFFNVDPDNPNYSVTLDLSGNPVTINPGDTLEIWVDFFDEQTGAKQHLEVFDLPVEGGSNQDMSANLFGTGMPGDPGFPAFFRLEFTGTMGTLDETVYETMGGSCTQQCNSFPLGGDLLDADSSFLYHDFHIFFEPSTSTQFDPFTIDTVTFGGAADAIDIGLWPVPSPGSLALLGLGLAGLGAMSRKQIKQA